MSSRSKNYQRNNIFIFVIIILISLGSIVTSKYTLDKQEQPVEPGYLSLNNEKFNGLNNKTAILVCDRNSFFKENHPFIELKKRSIKIEFVAVPNDSNHISLLSKLFPTTNVISLKELLTYKRIHSDVIVYDLQHIGLRDEQYTNVLKHTLEFAASHDKKIIISDRMNYFTANYYNGPLVQVTKLSQEKVFNAPMFYGLTSGELSLAISEEHFISGDIDIVLMKNFFRSRKPRPFDFHTNIIGSESYKISELNTLPLKSYLSLFNFSFNTIFRFTEKPIQFNIKGVTLFKTYTNNHIGYKLKYDGHDDLNYFEFFYKFTQLLIQNREIKLDPELELKINNFIGSHDFIESIKNGDSWEHYNQLLRDYKDTFYEQHQSFLLY